jgi:hypothetical protein
LGLFVEYLRQSHSDYPSYIREPISIITMKHFILPLLLCTSISAYAQKTFPCAGSIILLMDSASAAATNLQPDAYSHELTSFDLAIRFDKMPETLKQEDYLKKAATSVRDWPDDEQAKLKDAFDQIDAFVKKTGVHLHLPDTVKMIKTTAAEEFGAEGYTRGNRIMLNTKAEPIGLHLVAHELWHVISRLNEPLRNEAYAVFHFRPCNNIAYKPALHNQVITNPDCPFLQHCVRIEKDGSKQDVAPILYSKDAYKQGAVMLQGASVGLLALTGDDHHKQPLMKDGQPVVYELEAVPDFTKQIGMNTAYVLHVEEIVAEHFASLAEGRQLKQMEYVAGLKTVLMK